MDTLVHILTTVACSLIVALITWVMTKTVTKAKSFSGEHHELIEIKDEFKELMEQHTILMESQRNQLKAQIVEIYERAKSRESDQSWNKPWVISFMELDTLNRLADSYFALGGNHYIHSIVKKANEMAVGGEEIPI